MGFRFHHFFMGLALAGALAACGGKGGTPDAGGESPDASVPDAGPTCFTNPQTHVEILNACTTSQGIDKQTTLPLLKPDGTLPPLP